MGTHYTIKLASLPNDTSLQDLQAAVETRLQTINNQMSTWIETSELSRFNKQTATEFFAVSPETALVVAEAIRISQLTEGAFDVTVGPLINLWNFGEQPGLDRIPTDDEIAAAQLEIGFNKLEVRTDSPALRKERGSVYVNLSAIAKGFAVDEIAEYLCNVGITGYMVDIGGEVKTAGSKADGTPWRIGIQSPLKLQSDVYKSVTLRNQAMATSGDYRNYFEKQGKRYSHTIDPRTGRPIEHRLASVSVIHQSCMTADALATAITVLGPEAGYDLATKEKLPILLLIYDGSGFIEKATPEFESLITQPESSTATIFIAALSVFLLAILGMSVGVIFSNRCIKGTCGGLGNLKDENGNSLCEACTTPSEECADRKEQLKTTSSEQ